MNRRLASISVVFGLSLSPALHGAAYAAGDTPESGSGRELRYHPEGTDFVIRNGREFFNRALYGGNAGFRVEAGDRPEFAFYLPGRGGNLRVGLVSAAAAGVRNGCTRRTRSWRAIGPGRWFMKSAIPCWARACSR